MQRRVLLAFWFSGPVEPVCLLPLRAASLPPHSFCFSACSVSFFFRKSNWYFWDDDRQDRLKGWPVPGFQCGRDHRKALISFHIHGYHPLKLNDRSTKGLVKMDRRALSSLHRVGYLTPLCAIFKEATWLHQSTSTQLSVVSRATFKRSMWASIWEARHSSSS